MNKGELQQIDEPMELYKNPSNLFVAEFVGTPRINMVKGEISEKDGQFGLEADGLFFPLIKIKNIDIGQKVTMAVRSEDINLTKPEKKGSLDFSIYSTLPTGADIFTRVYDNKVFFTVRQEERVIHEPETKVGIDFIDDSLLIYDFKTGNLLGKTSLKK